MGRSARMGQLTVELVAALGVMAGAKSEHMPLMLTIIKTLKHPDFDWRGVSTTTAPTVPLVIVNGPIVERLKLTSGTGAFGGEQPVNVALGYFINLVGHIVGGSVPNEQDKSSQGSPGDLVAMVAGENEKDNPWKQSYTTEHGFKPTDSVLSAFGAYIGTNNTNHSSVKGTLLNTFAAGIAGGASGITSCLTDYTKGYALTNKVKYVFLLLGPKHAATIAKDVPTKKATQEYLVAKSALPFWGYAPTLCKPPKEFGPYSENTMIPRFTTTDQIHLVVVGGPGKQSQIWPTFPTSMRPVSAIVDE